MQKSNIHPTIFQPFFDSASNAADKGQAQWFTPPEWGRVLSRALNRYRPVIVDLNCGNGQLLEAARSHSHLLGCDIEGESRSRSRSESRSESESESESKKTPTPTPTPTLNHVQADLTRFYPLLHAVNWEADCFVLNPPWDLHWYRSHLSPLSQSSCPAVAEAFTQHDGRLGQDTIDSTAATLMLALDRMSQYGDGFLIGNEATLQRLILGSTCAPHVGSDAPSEPALCAAHNATRAARVPPPHGALARHIWAHLVVTGNICQGKTEKLKAETLTPAPISGSQHFRFSDFQTGIIWFSRCHEAGLRYTAAQGFASHLKDAERFVEQLRDQRQRYRQGPETSDTLRTHDTVSLWHAAAEEWQRLNPQPSLNTPHYNLWLEHGCIRTNLSLFDTASGRVGKAEAAQLYELTDKQPMQLVVDRNSRRALCAAAGLPAGLQPATCNLQPATSPTPWRVHPDLLAAVAEALRQFEGERTPLAALPPIQRLGFLDEHDFITCRKDLPSDGLQVASCKLQVGSDLTTNLQPATRNLQLTSLFRAGQRYPLRSATVLVKRQTEKRNLWGLLEEIELDGQELAFFITDGQGREHVFMEARLREPGVTVSVIAPGVRELARKIADADLTPCPIDYTVQELVNHFIIPAVPHAALVFKQDYERNLKTLEQIEQLVNA